MSELRHTAIGQAHLRFAPQDEHRAQERWNLLWQGRALRPTSVRFRRRLPQGSPLNYLRHLPG